MNETEKKCLIASASLHGFLLLILVVGSAFFTPSRKPALPERHLTMIPEKFVLDATSGGGGNPDAGPALGKRDERPPVPLPPPPKQPDPPAKTPEVKRVDPPKVEKTPVKEVTKTRDNKLNPFVAVQPKKTVKDPPNEKPDLGPIVRAETADKIRKKAQAEAEARQRVKAEAEAQAKTREYARVMEQRNRQYEQAIGNLESSLPKGTVVGIRGPGGQSYAGYDQYVKLMYQNAWRVSPGMTDEDSIAEATVIINRDGSIDSARLSKRSGNPALDLSVENALRNVRSLRPFPEGSTDTRRPYTIEFNLKAKRLTG